MIRYLFMIAPAPPPILSNRPRFADSLPPTPPSHENRPPETPIRNGGGGGDNGGNSSQPPNKEFNRRHALGCLGLFGTLIAAVEILVRIVSEPQEETWNKNQVAIQTIADDIVANPNDPKSVSNFIYLISRTDNQDRLMSLLMKKKVFSSLLPQLEKFLLKDDPEKVRDRHPDLIHDLINKGKYRQAFQLIKESLNKLSPQSSNASEAIRLADLLLKCIDFDKVEQASLHTAPAEDSTNPTHQQSPNSVQ